MLSMMGVSQEPQLKRSMCLSVRCRQGRDIMMNLRLPQTKKSLYIGYEACAHEYYQRITANLEKYTKKEDFFQELKFFGESLHRLGMENSYMVVFREGIEECKRVFAPNEKYRKKPKRSRESREHHSTDLTYFLDSAIHYCAEGSLSSHQLTNSLRCYGMQNYVNYRAKREKLGGRDKGPFESAVKMESTSSDTGVEEKPLIQTEQKSSETLIIEPERKSGSTFAPLRKLRSTDSNSGTSHA